jgi:hypothetical protein
LDDIATTFLMEVVRDRDLLVNDYLQLPVMSYSNHTGMALPEKCP